MAESQRYEILDAVAFWSAAAALVLLPVGTALFEILFGVSVASALLALALQRRQPLPHYWQGAAALIGVAVVSGLLAVDPPRSLRLAAKLLYLAAALGLMRGRPGSRALAAVFLLLGSVVALHSLVAIGTWSLWGGEVRTEIDYLQLAQMAVMCLALLAPLPFCRGLPAGMRVWAAGLVLVLAAHGLLSGSRAALLCLGALALAEIARRSRPALLVLPPVFFAAYAALPESRRERIREAFLVEDSAKDPPSSLRMRLDMARTGLAIAAEHPFFGVGLDGVRVVYDRYKAGSLENDPPASDGRRRRKWPNLHDDYVQIAAELGFLGLAAYGLLLVQVLRGPLPDASDPALQAIARGVRGALCLFVLGGVFYKCFLNFYPWRLFVVLAAIDSLLRPRRS